MKRKFIYKVSKEEIEKLINEKQNDWNNSIIEAALAEEKEKIENNGEIK